MQPYQVIHKNVWAYDRAKEQNNLNDHMADCARKEDENLAYMDMINKDCQRAGTLKYRCFHLQVADGYAYYQIMKVNKDTVMVRHIEGLGDNYMDDILGQGGTFPLPPIKRLIEAEDLVKDLIS